MKYLKIIKFTINYAIKEAVFRKSKEDDKRFINYGIKLEASAAM
jgi:hypothetical protein